MQLPEFLSLAGYHRISLKRSGVGHFHASASLRGRPISALVDTGAGCTLVSLALARELELGLTLQAEKGAGAGNADIDVYVVEDDRLELAEVSIRPRMLLAMDLSHVNEALIQKGESPVEAIMGLDVFEEHAAVIDYGSQSLYLRE
jgi:predicted aspartyl protease